MEGYEGMGCVRVYIAIEHPYPEATPRVQRSYGGCDCYWLVDG